MPSDNPVITALQQFFGPLLKFTSRWPPLLAYGLVTVSVILVSVVLGAVIPRDLLWLLGIVVLASLVAFISTDWYTRHQSTIREQSSVEHILSSSVVYVVVHEIGDQTKVIPDAEVTLALPVPETKKTNFNGSTEFIVPNRYIGKEFAINARKLGYKAREPLKLTLHRDAYEFIPLETDSEVSLADEIPEDTKNEHEPTKEIGKLIYDSRNEDKPFISWTLFSTAGGFRDRITITKRSSDGIAAFGLRAFAREFVGVNKSFRMLHGRIEFEYQVVYSEASGPNIFFYIIPMQETGIGRSGLIEVGTNVQDDPRNAFSPYRVKFFVPLKYSEDGRWHHKSMEFDFRDTPNVFYSIFGPRLNEGSVHPGAAYVLFTNVEVFSYE